MSIRDFWVVSLYHNWNVVNYFWKKCKSSWKEGVKRIHTLGDYRHYFVEDGIRSKLHQSDIGHGDKPKSVYCHHLRRRWCCELWWEDSLKRENKNKKVIPTKKNCDSWSLMVLRPVILTEADTLKELIFAGTNFRFFRGFSPKSRKFAPAKIFPSSKPRKLIPAKNARKCFQNLKIETNSTIRHFSSINFIRAIIYFILLSILLF